MNKMHYLLPLAMATVLAGPAQASSLLNPFWLPDQNLMEDTDAERVLRANQSGGYDIISSGNLQVGDIIQSALRWDTINGNQVPGSENVQNFNYQFTALSELRIDSLVNLSQNFGVQQVNGFDVYEITFGAANHLLGNSLVNLYETTDSAEKWNPAADSPDAAISKILSQDFLASFGLNGDDDFWTSTSLVNINAIASIQKGTDGATAGRFGLSVISNPGALPIAADAILSTHDGNYHDIIGNTFVYAKESNVNGSWLVSSDTKAYFRVPEPTSLMLLGLGAMIMGRMRASKQA